jgi:hypothetical protein
MIDADRDDIAKNEQEIIDRTKAIAGLAKTGVDLENSIARPTAVLATSMEAIQEAIRTGHLPTGIRDSGGRLYFYPLEENTSEEDISEIKDGLDAYGHILGFEQNFAQSLGLDRGRDGEFIAGIFEAIQNILLFDFIKTRGKSSGLSTDGEREDLSILENITLDDFAKASSSSKEYIYVYAEELAKKNITFKEIMEKAIKSYSRRGVLIGLGGNIADLKPKPAEDRDEGWYVDAPDGLSIDYFSGITPLTSGGQEGEYLEGLKKKFN